MLQKKAIIDARTNENTFPGYTKEVLPEKWVDDKNKPD
jgi:hypothetical protein